MQTRRSLLVGLAGLPVASLLSSCAASPRAPGVVRSSSRDVLTVLEGIPTVDGAGVSLTRVIGQQALRHLDPFLLLDRFHSDDPGAYIRGFPDHPHRGFETITVMLEGRMQHRDSRGNAGTIVGGGVQWMTAGRGIVHSEMPRQDHGLLSGYQLWLNLPAHEKMCEPAYQDLDPSRIREVTLERGAARIVAGAAYGMSGPVAPHTTAPLLLTVALADERRERLDVPRGHTSFVFVHRGAVDIGQRHPTRVREGSIAILDEGDALDLAARADDTLVLVAAARPLREPIVHHGPFVMNTEEEIERAIADYRNGTLGT